MSVRMDSAVAERIRRPPAGPAQVRAWTGHRSRLTALGVRVLASGLTVGAALVLCLPVLWLAGAGVPSTVDALWRGSWGSERAAGETLVQMIPLLMAGLAVAVAFHGGLFNIGVEGQLTVGGLTAGVVGARADTLPGPVLMVACLAAGALAGAVWTLIPALLKAWRGVHEVVTTIMLNYIAISVSAWAVSPSGPFVSARQPSATDRIPVDARLPVILTGTRLHAGLFVALAAAVLVGWYLYRTPGGFRLRLVGANPRAAASVGISAERSVVRVFLLSGSLAGLAGGVQVLGLFGRYYDASSSGYGYDAIAVALLGALAPIGIVAAALFFATLSAGSVLLQAEAGINRELVSVVSGLVVALVLAQPWIVRGLARLTRRGPLPAGVAPPALTVEPQPGPDPES